MGWIDLMEYSRRIAGCSNAKWSKFKLSGNRGKEWIFATAAQHNLLDVAGDILGNEEGCLRNIA